jgi:YVTN family beta-propeller protein
VSISAQPQTIIEGDSAILTWSSANADSASLDNGIGLVPINGSTTVSPANTITYNIMVQGQGGTATASTVVTVLHKPTVTITASPNPIDEGETTTLTWSSTNADSATIDQGIGNVDVNGSLEVDSLESTTFTITVTGQGGTAAASVTVEVLAPPAPRKTYAYIPNMAGDDVSVVDLQTNTVTSHIEVGYGPYGVAVSPDGDTAYVTSRENGISIINAATNILTGSIPVFSDTIAVSPDGEKLYGVSRDEGTLISIDIASGAILDEIEVGPAPHGIAVNNEGTRIYVSSLEDGIVRAIDATTMAVISTVAITQPGDPVWDVEVSPDGSKVYAVSSIGCKLTVINVRSNTVMDTRYYTESIVSECYLAVSPDGQTIALSDVSIMAMTIYLINSQSLDIMDLFQAQSPSDLDFTADGQFVYCPDIWTGSVYVVNSWESWLECIIEDGFADPHVYGHFIAEHKELISGKVVSDGQGVEGIEVTLSNEFMSRTFLTDAQGRYYFHVPPGDYRISFSAGRYVVSQQELDVAVRSGEVVVPDMEVLLAVRVWSDPVTIIAGESANLQWTSVKASSVSIDHGIGNVGLSGIYTVSPAETTTYTVTATDGYGRSVTDHVTITVLQLPTVNITADRQGIVYGETVSLSWTSTNAQRVVLEPYGWDMDLSGTYTDTPDDTITYIITAYGPGGTASASVMVEVYYPPTVSLSAQPETIYAGQSSTLTWTSSDAEHVSIDSGIGEVDPNGSMAVSPTQTTTYTITATGPGGTITDSATVTVNSIISLNIVSPVNNAQINRPDIMVRGTVTNAYGYETGVTVNGMPAVVYGNQFVVNHVPLLPGANSITVHAVDVRGNASDRIISIDSEVLQPYITLSSNDTIGISPFESILRIEYFFEPESLTFSDTGSGQVVYLDGAEANERVLRITNKGIYFITADVYKDGIVYRDTIGIVVHDRDDLDAMLRQKWEGMRSALVNNDIESAVKNISSKTKNTYRNAFGYLTNDQRSNLSKELGNIQLIKIKGAGVEYDIQTARNGTLYSFYLLFELDEDGVWKISRF